MKTSLLVSTYNRPAALKLCLQSVLAQTQLPDEIVIADDGSGAPTRAVVVAMQQQSKVPIVHVWHEDDGFRLAAIRNKALIASNGNYIIQVDGDLILHRHFVRDHVRFAKRGQWLKGNRAMLSESITNKLEHLGQEFPKHIFFQPGIVKRKTLLPLSFFIRPIAHLFPYKGVLGGNMSYWREDAMKVNGFDEHFEGWGKEDDDFVHRLMRIGVKPAQLFFAAHCYHLHHPEADRSKFRTNQKLLEKRDQLGAVLATKGIQQLTDYIPPLNG